MLTHAKKYPWPPFPLVIIGYIVVYIKVSKEESQYLFSFHFGDESFRRNGSKKIVECHCHTCRFNWPYANDFWRDEYIYKRAHSLNNLDNRLGTRGKRLHWNISLKRRRIKRSSPYRTRIKYQ